MNTISSSCKDFLLTQIISAEETNNLIVCILGLQDFLKRLLISKVLRDIFQMGVIKDVKGNECFSVFKQLY